MQVYRGRNQLVLPIESLSNQDPKCDLSSSMEALYIRELRGTGYKIQPYIRTAGKGTNAFAYIVSFGEVLIYKPLQVCSFLHKNKMKQI